MWVATYAFLSAVMDALGIASVSAFYESVLGKCFFGLYQAPTPVPTPGMLMANITEANYDGYARQAITWFPTFLDAAGPQDLAAMNMRFSPSDAVVPNTITGAFIATAATGGLLYLAAALPVPIALPSPAYSTIAAPVFQLAYTNNYGNPNMFV